MYKIALIFHSLLRSVTIDPTSLPDPDMSNDSQTLVKPLNEFLVRYKGFIMGVLGIAFLTMIIIFMVHFSRLAATAGLPVERKKVISGIIYSAIASAVLGSLTVFFALIYSSLK